ncbi:MAG: hypothetical protein ACREDP_20700 [Bradyrhizobium sp.]
MARGYLGLLACALFNLAPAHAQTAYTPPRTADGHPDLQGVWAGHFMTGLERPDDVKDLIVPADQAADIIAKLSWTPKGVYDPDVDYFMPDKLLSVSGTLRSSWIVEPGDGQLPVTALAKSALEKSEDLSDFGFDNPEERPTSERCVTGLGYPPLHDISIVIPYLIVQTPGAIVMVSEDTDPARIIHMTGPAPPEVIRSRAGYSAGHWDGDTLVIETTHIAADDPAGVLERGGMVLARGSHVTERLALQSDTELLYQFTIEDPSFYHQQWRAEFVLLRQDGHVYEYACHEGNGSMVNILTAARLGRQDTRKK